VFPAAVNSVPSRARIEIDVRDIDQARRDQVLRKIEQACKEISARRGVRAKLELVNADPPAECAPLVVDALMQASKTHRLACERMISRAYHDSLFMSRIAPTAMLFIPCRGGVSHRPDEYASPEAIAQGTLVLAETLAQLAS
jgi:ureidoglycolate amidohydrolase